MGGRLGRNRLPTDPFYNAVSPAAIADPTGGLGVYDPYEEYGQEFMQSQSIGNMYGGPVTPRPSRYGGLYAQGLNQMPGVLPWNYGNYYLGNTTMQMMPFMMNKLGKYGQMQGMSMLGNSGSFGAAPVMPSMPCCMQQSFSMPNMPSTPCCTPQPYNNMSMAAPMMAAATPLPVAFNPLVQGMYPMASTSPVNWMTPSTFMSALTSGPMPYRPPAFDFPSNVGMVMAIPYGTPNPLLSSPTYSGISSSYSVAAGGPSWSSCYYGASRSPVSSPSPPVSYYPQQYNYQQQFPIPYSAPLALPYIEQIPAPSSMPVAPLSMPVAAPPMIPPESNQNTLVSATMSLSPSQATFIDNTYSQPVPMGPSRNSTRRTLTRNDTTNGSLPVYNPTDQSQFLIGQRISSSLSNSVLNKTDHSNFTISSGRHRNRSHRGRDTTSERFRRFIPSIPRLTYTNYNSCDYPPRSDPILPPILCGELISDSGWLPREPTPPPIPSILTRKKKERPIYGTENAKSMLHTHVARVSFLPHRRRHHSNSSASEYDCTICQQQREKRRLREYYGSSTVSSLLSLPKEHTKHRIISNDSILSSTLYSPPTFQKESYKSSTIRLPTKIKNKSKSSSSERSNSPVLLRKSPLHDQRQNISMHDQRQNINMHDQRQNVTIHEVDEEEDDTIKEEPSERKLTDDNDSSMGKSEQHVSQISLDSKDT
ncbi:unnamed protein product [Adineta steineri]|uniref:Uncharacterized protein n=1 Tax=Adineta steineri TaxID=433720 RepID=A0A814HBN3_9BILA|nr:unnamed protein product [Adineta steineri]CAF3729267.1 unnamed protein product [Adineta steineri]